MNEAVALPYLQSAAIGVVSVSIPALAPVPRETAVGPAFAPGVELAPMPRAIEGAETPSGTVVGPLTVTLVETPVVAAPVVESIAEPQAVETNWGWWGGMAAVLLAGGYWMLRQIRLNRGAAKFKKLPSGTILSTDLQLAW